MNWLLEPLQSTTLLWLAGSAFCVALACGLPGTFLVLRRMSLVGDAVSHSVLPGIVIGFIFTGSLTSPWLLAGAALAGVGATLIIEQIHSRTRIKQDAAIGIAFTGMFALGVLLLRLFASRVDLDPDCVLFGSLESAVLRERWEIFGLLIPRVFVVQAVVAGLTVLLVVGFFRVLMLASFDAGLAASFGYRPALVSRLLLVLVSVIVVAAFQAVGAILVIALLILPGASAYLCCVRLPAILWGAALHALLSSLGGLLLAYHTNSNGAAGIVLAGGILFLAAWLFGPADGLVVRKLRSRRGPPPGPAAGA
jgi:manganese/zinc/iron transport system permease protein